MLMSRRRGDVFYPLSPGPEDQDRLHDHRHHTAAIQMKNCRTNMILVCSLLAAILLLSANHCVPCSKLGRFSSLKSSGYKYSSIKRTSAGRLSSVRSPTFSSPPFLSTRRTTASAAKSPGIGFTGTRKWRRRRELDTKCYGSKPLGYHPVADEEEVAHLTDYLKHINGVDSPLVARPGFEADIMERDEKVLVDVAFCKGELCEDDARTFLRAGPREKIFFKPEEVKAGIVTCGGLCPGLNSVVREVTNSLWENYGVRDITGFRYGLRGLRADLSPSLEKHKNDFCMELNPKTVAGIHQMGGTILGTGRGYYDRDGILATAKALGINMLFIVGGDGTHAAANAIYESARDEGLKMSVVAIPKTIDNDINIIDRSFGFETSIEEAQRAIESAKVEAKASINGIGIVRLMGRHSGAITLMASLASNDVDIALIPEIEFSEEKFLEHLLKVLQKKQHAVIVAAEGMAEVALKELQQKAMGGEQLAKGGATQPISGDIGQHLRAKIKACLSERNMDHRLVNIDPTYMIRSIPANAGDRVYCAVLAQQAVHGAMAGFTGFSAGMVSTNYVYIPILEVIKAGPRKVDPNGQMWYRLITSTQQPASFKADLDDAEGSSGSVDAAEPSSPKKGKEEEHVASKTATSTGEAAQ